MRPLAKSNHHVVRLGRLVRQRRFRSTEGAFVVDGPVLVAEAFTAGLPCEALFVDKTRPVAEIEELIRRAEAVGAEVFSVATDVLRHATDPKSPQGVAAIFGRQIGDWSVLALASLVLVLVEVQDPGNAGTLVRAATAAGADAVIATAGTVDLFAPKTVRGSAGAVLGQVVLEGGAVSEVISQLAEVGIRTVAAVPGRGEPYDLADLSGRVAVLVGNEAHGFDRSIEATVDQIVHIPMPGSTESLNVAMAGTLVCFEISRQRRVAARASQLDVDNPATESSPRHER